MTKAGIGVLVGVVIGAGVGGIGGTVASVAVSTQKRIEVRRGWNSTPAMVAKRDLAAGDVLTLDATAQRSVAESLLSGAQIQAADFAIAENSRLVVLVKAGQPIEWPFLRVVPLEQVAARDACTTAMQPMMRGAR